jgi:hypothetical protein
MNFRPTMKCLAVFVAAAALLIQPPLAAQLAVHSLLRDPQSVTLHWQGGRGPLVVETNRGYGWSVQGEPGTGTARTLASFGEVALYRVSDLDPAGAFGPFFGLVQTTQGEFGDLMARHRLKSRLWFYRTTGGPHTAPSFTAAEYFLQLITLHQYHEHGRVQVWTGSLESLGQVSYPTAQSLRVTWSRGEGPERRTYELLLRFPYAVRSVRSVAPRPSDPEYSLRCVRATPEPEFNGAGMTLEPTHEDKVDLSQLDPANPQLTFPRPQQFRVSHRGATLDFHFHEGLPLTQGEPPMIWKTAILDRWLSPTAAGGTLPVFRVDSYFSQTLMPGHHSFTQTLLVEPSLDPSLSEAVREELARRNIRYLRAFKDLMIGFSPDDIRYIGFDGSVREP